MSASATGVWNWIGRHWRPVWMPRSAVVAAVIVAGLVLSTAGAGSIALGSPSTAGAGQGRPAAGPPSDTAALQPEASRLAMHYAGNPRALGERGRMALVVGRNDATVADFLRLRWVGRLDAQLERYGAWLASTDQARLALGVAGVEHYGTEIHNGLLHNGPSRLIIVSIAVQRLVAYDNGRTIVDTPVTTGRPSLPTDIGAMRVLSKDAPWTMHSPWPQGAPEWYPDTPVQMVLWFTRNGEGLHDASWQPAATLGPGSQFGPFSSHGCIHLTPAAVKVLFDWAPIGTPVVVDPGDGSPLASQALQQSVDA